MKLMSERHQRYTFIDFLIKCLNYLIMWEDISVLLYFHKSLFSDLPPVLEFVCFPFHLVIFFWKFEQPRDREPRHNKGGVWQWLWTIWPSSSIPKYLSKNKIGIQKTCTQIFISSLFIIVTKEKNLSTLSRREKQYSAIKKNDTEYIILTERSQKQSMHLYKLQKTNLLLEEVDW